MRKYRSVSDALTGNGDVGGDYTGIVEVGGEPGTLNLQNTVNFPLI